MTKTLPGSVGLAHQPPRRPAVDRVFLLVGAVPAGDAEHFAG
ncbi:hypothetical protein ABID94_003111 [Streptomyces sp. PvR018]